MRVGIPEFADKKQLFSYLKSNEKDLIFKKKSMPIKSEVVPELAYGCVGITAKTKDKVGKSVTKMVGEDSNLKDGELKADVLANMAGWCDSYDDVLIPKCYNKTISSVGASNKQLIYHLKNHFHSTDGIVGGNVMMSTRDIDLSIFNLKTDLKTSEGLIGSSVVRKKYCLKTYDLYLDDEIKQHSIGLQYVKIYLCINSEDEEYKEELSNYNKYYKYIINKEKVDKQGFFWAVTEIKLLEYSAVLWGASELTTVQETSKNIEPSEDLDTQKHEPEAVGEKDTSLTEFYNHLKFN